MSEESTGEIPHQIAFRRRVALVTFFAHFSAGIGLVAGRYYSTIHNTAYRVLPTDSRYVMTFSADDAFVLGVAWFALVAAAAVSYVVWCQRREETFRAIHEA